MSSSAQPPADPPDLTGGTAVITGAASGLGAGFAHRAAELGMSIVLVDIDERVHDSAADLTRRGRPTTARVVDVTDYSAVDALAAECFEQFGSVELLINNAGILVAGRTWEIEASIWRKIIDVNLLGVVHGMQAFIPKMLLTGQPAHIINVASTGALRTRPDNGAYLASKHACLVATECAASELAAMGAPLTVTAAVPGPIRSEIAKRALLEADGPHSERATAALSKALAQDGLDPLDAATTILEAARQGRSHVHTHPDKSRQLIEQRFASLISNID